MSFASSSSQDSKKSGLATPPPVTLCRVEDLACIKVARKNAGFFNRLLRITSTIVLQYPVVNLVDTVCFYLEVIIFGKNDN